MFGGDMLYEVYRFGSRERTDERPIFKAHSNPMSSIAAISIIVNCATGSEPFFSESYYVCGIGNFVLAAVVMLIVSLISFKAYIRTWRYDSQTSFSEALVDAFGPKSIPVIRVLLILSLLSQILYNTRDVQSYANLFTEYYFPSVTILQNKYLVLYVLTFVTTIFSSFIRSFSRFSYISYVGNVSFIVTFALLLYYFAENVKDVGGSGLWDNTSLGSWKLQDTFNLAFYFLHGYFLHPMISNLAPELKFTTQGRISRVAGWAYFFSFLKNFLPGLCLYFTLFGVSQGNFALSYLPSSAPRAFVGLFGLIHILCTNMLMNYLLAIELTKFFTDDLSKTNNVLMGSLVVSSFAVGMNIAPYQIVDWICYICNYVCLFVCLFLPFVAYLKMFGWKNLWGIYSIFFGIVALAIIVFIIVYVFVERSPVF